MRPLSLRVRGAVSALPSPPQAPVFSPFDLAGLIGAFDASAVDNLTLSDGLVTGIANGVSGGLPLKALGTNFTSAPLYDPENPLANGLPALIWGDGNRGLELYHPALGQAVDAQLADLFIVCAYGDGLTEAFGGYTRLLGSSVATIAQGHPNRNRILHTSVMDRASKNGGEFSPVLLPMPLSVLRFSAENQGLASFLLSSFGMRSPSSLSRSWDGPICEVLAFDRALTAEEADQITQHLMQKWGIKS